MNNIYLIGMMGCGKTTCAGALGKKLGRAVRDTDHLIEKQAGKTISEIFAEQGEEAFRAMETALCRSLAEQENLVVATGGGLPLRPENRELLRNSGRVIFLHRDPEEIYASLDIAGRPLAQQGKDAFLKRFSERLPLYRAACHGEITEFSSVHATVAAILEKLEEQT